MLSSLMQCFVMWCIYSISSVNSELITKLHGVPPQNVLCFLFFALFIGAFISYALSRIGSGLPYTVVVAIFGVLMSVVFQLTNSHNVLEESIVLWDHINPKLILFIFLPALLFGEAMSLSPHHFSGAFVSSLLLAFPGAALSAFIIAAGARYAFPYHWSWPLCLIFGSILCVTDAVAVVALLKKAGAGNRLSYLLIGESLFNDGTALVLYNIFFTLIDIHGDPAVVFSPAHMGIFLIKVFFISPLLGVAFGAGALLLMGLANRRMHEDDTTLQIAVTICCAYLSFFTAEEVLKVSGVICCVTAALMLAHFAPPLVLHQQTMYSVWSTIEWVGNTLIFALAGLIIGTRSIVYIEPRDCAYIVVSYIFVQLSRAFIVLLCFPVLSHVGRKCTAKEAVFVAWGGLRGAVSMALALSLERSVENGTTTEASRQSHQVFILVGGTAVLTLLINATTSNTALRRLGLVDENVTMESDVLYHYVKKRIFRKAHQILEHVSLALERQNEVAAHEQQKLYTVDTELVRRYCSLFNEFSLAESEDGSAQQRGAHSGAQSGRSHHASSPDNNALNKPNPAMPRNFSDPHHLMMPVSSLNNHSAAQMMNRIRSEVQLHISRPPEPIPDLVVRVRKTFLGVVRVHYWRQINSGKLPRTSTATLELLNSIDVALETHAAGLQDWEALRDSNRILFRERRHHFSAQMARPYYPSVSREASQGTGSLAHDNGRVSGVALVEAQRSDEELGYNLFSDETTSNRSNGSQHNNSNNNQNRNRNGSASGLPPTGNSASLPNYRTFTDPISTTRDRGNMSVIAESARENEQSTPLTRTSATKSNPSRVKHFLGWFDIRNLLTGCANEAQYEHDRSPEHRLSHTSSRSRTNLASAAASGESVKTDANPHNRNEGAGNSEGDDDLSESEHHHLFSWAKHDPLHFLRHLIGDYYVAKKVYILTSFIEAHEFAQTQIQFFLGESETAESPEELVVIRESKRSVLKAKRRLAEIDSAVVTHQVSKQTARWLLHTEEDMIAEFQNEGILTEADALVLLEEVQRDLNRLGAVEWSSILLSKLMHRAEASLVFLCSGWAHYCGQCMGSSSRRGRAGSHPFMSRSVSSTSIPLPAANGRDITRDVLERPEVAPPAALDEEQGEGELLDGERIPGVAVKDEEENYNAPIVF